LSGARDGAASGPGMSTCGRARRRLGDSGANWARGLLLAAGMTPNPKLTTWGEVGAPAGPSPNASYPPALGDGADHEPFTCWICVCTLSTLGRLPTLERR
jgi:hypothetical protein